MVRPRSDDGATLIESLVAISIVGVSFSALVGGMFTVVQASDINRSQASVATHLASYAEAVKGDPYAACATSYPASSFALPAGFAREPVRVDYWSSTTQAFSATCGTDSGLQRVTLELRTTDGRVKADVQLAKRAP
jgi:type II secretory pathway pseudopilin PulG